MMTPDVVPQNLTQWVGFIVWVVTHSTLEYFLGKKQPLGAGSVFEFLWCLIKKIFRRKSNECSVESDPKRSG